MHTNFSLTHIQFDELLDFLFSLARLKLFFSSIMSFFSMLGCEKLMSESRKNLLCECVRGEREVERGKPKKLHNVESIFKELKHFFSIFRLSVAERGKIFFYFRRILWIHGKYIHKFFFFYVKCIFVHPDIDWL